HDLLAAAMAEALAHDTGLGAWLECQRLARDAELLLAGGLGLAHSVLCPYCPPVGACALTVSGERPARKYVKRATRVRKVSLPGPASRAACTTFGRFNAKSNWAPEKSPMTAISRTFSSSFSSLLRRKRPSSLRFPSLAPSLAWITARASLRPTAAST